MKKKIKYRRRMEPEGSSSSSCTYTESYCQEEDLYVCLGEEEDEEEEEEGGRGGGGRGGEQGECRDEARKYSSEKSVSSEADFENFETEEDASFGMKIEAYELAEEMSPTAQDEEDEVRDSIFVHSAPDHFPDIVWARRSAFSSIFVRTPARKQTTSGTNVNNHPESQFTMIPVNSDSFKRDSDKPTVKSSVLRAFEKRGIKKYSSNESQWDIFPIIKSALFSFHIQDRVHQTRKLNKVEERIATGKVQTLKFTHIWPSGSSWTGHWDGLGMAGTGTYVMPDDVCYIGKMRDSMCHDTDAILIYPNGFKAIHCNYVDGQLTDYQFIFPDNLEHEKENWNYCQHPDRRFWTEIQFGLKPGKLAQRTLEDTPRKIPDYCYDTNDGFYNPKTKMIFSENGELIRVPTAKEEEWIKENCRKGFREYTGFRPDLYENWYNNDRELIDALVNMRKMYEAGRITYDELQDFYADSGIKSPSFLIKNHLTTSDLESGKAATKHPPNSPLYHLKKIYEGRRKPKPSMATPSPKQKPPKKCFASKKQGSSEKISGKIKFSDGIRTATNVTSTTNVSETYSMPISRKANQPATPSSYGVATEISGESDTSQYRRKLAQEIAKELMSDMVYAVVFAERERHRDRFIRTQIVGNISFGARDHKERCVQILEELYRSIPEKEEFGDSVEGRACDLKKLAEDRFQTIRYWGKRIFTLSFDENQ